MSGNEDIKKLSRSETKRLVNSKPGLLVEMFLNNQEILSSYKTGIEIQRKNNKELMQDAEGLVISITSILEEYKTGPIGQTNITKAKEVLEKWRGKHGKSD